MTHGSRADGMLCSCSMREGLLRPGLLRVDDRALAGDRDRLLHGRDAELRADVGAEADGHVDVLLDDRLEAGELELHAIGADVESRELEGSRFPRGRRQRLQERRAGQRDRDAGQHGAGLVRHLAEDLARLLLGARRRCAENDRQRRQHGGKTPFHLFIPQESRN